jgi:hypothetical protein
MEHCDPEMREDILNNVVEFEQVFLDRPSCPWYQCAACGTAVCVLWESENWWEMSNYTSTDTFEGSSCGNSNVVLNF